MVKLAVRNITIDDQISPNDIMYIKQKFPNLQQVIMSSCGHFRFSYGHHLDKYFDTLIGFLLSIRSFDFRARISDDLNIINQLYAA
jgi:hypothetical protein